MKRRILVFTGTRAEYSLLEPVLCHLAKMDAVETHLLVSGSHLSAEYGGTISRIPPTLAHIHEVPLDLRYNTPVGICHSMGGAIDGYGRVICDVAPDLAVLLGDRYEALCMAAASVTMRVPVAHLHGGETTRGAVDEAYRHAITKMSHLHFTSCEMHRQRVIQLGENPEYVWNVGAIGVENVHHVPVLPEKDVREFLNIPDGAPYLLSTYHPVTLEHDTGEGQIRSLLAALSKYPEIYVVFTGANADAGGAVINEILRRTAENNPRIRFFVSLGVVRYLSVARYSLGVVGNSSSGIIEIPSLGVPVLDIGERQRGRLRSEAVLHCDVDALSLEKGISALLAPDAVKQAQKLANPYDKPGTSSVIAKIIAAHPLEGILQKTFIDLDCSASSGNTRI